LLLDQADGSAHTPGGHSVIGETLQRTQRDEIAETVESLAPSGSRANQPQAFPVTQTAWLNS
jgi:hypothetical protein